jgi:hypothetical protein
MEDMEGILMGRDWRELEGEWVYNFRWWYDIGLGERWSDSDLDKGKGIE